jgi:hypothetical protein
MVMLSGCGVFISIFALFTCSGRQEREALSGGNGYNQGLIPEVAL